MCFININKYILNQTAGHSEASNCIDLLSSVVSDRLTKCVRNLRYASFYPISARALFFQNCCCGRNYLSVFTRVEQHWAIPDDAPSLERGFLKVHADLFVTKEAEPKRAPDQTVPLRNLSYVSAKSGRSQGCLDAE